MFLVGGRERCFTAEGDPGVLAILSDQSLRPRQTLFANTVGQSVSSKLRRETRSVSPRPTFQSEPTAVNSPAPIPPKESAAGLHPVTFWPSQDTHYITVGLPSTPARSLCDTPNAPDPRPADKGQDHVPPACFLNNLLKEPPSIYLHKNGSHVIRGGPAAGVAPPRPGEPGPEAEGDESEAASGTAKIPGRRHRRRPVFASNNYWAPAVRSAASKKATPELRGVEQRLATRGGQRESPGGSPPSLSPLPPREPSEPAQRAGLEARLAQGSAAAPSQGGGPCGPGARCGPASPPRPLSRPGPGGSWTARVDRERRVRIAPV